MPNSTSRIKPVQVLSTDVRLRQTVEGNVIKGEGWTLAGKDKDGKPSVLAVSLGPISGHEARTFGVATQPTEFLQAEAIADAISQQPGWRGSYFTNPTDGHWSVRATPQNLVYGDAPRIKPSDQFETVPTLHERWAKKEAAEQAFYGHKPFDL